MTIQNEPTSVAGRPALEEIIDGLANADKGASMLLRDYLRLAALGIVAPMMLLVWGWL